MKKTIFSHFQGKRTYLYLLTFLCVSMLGFAQDIHFSQYFNSDLTLNPSNTGNYEGDWRIMANYRSQWKEIDKAYLTQSIGFDHQFYLYSERLSGGLVVVNDKSGGNLKVMKIMGSVGYHKRLGTHFFHSGVQLGWVNKTLNFPENTFPSQFNWATGQFDVNLANQEPNQGQQLSLVDINLGGGWHSTFGKCTPYLGFSVFHVNAPKETFWGYDNRVKPRKVVHGKLRYALTEKLALEPGFMLAATTKASDLVMGARAAYTLQTSPFGNTALWAGLYYRDGLKRISDAFITMIGLDYKQYALGFSYDYNFSSLKTATDYKGGIEISFIYKEINTHVSKKEIPCERY